MRTLLALAAAALLAGCGVDAASSAATAASLKKAEIEQGQRTMQQARQKIDATMQQAQERAAAASEQQ